FVAVGAEVTEGVGHALGPGVVELVVQPMEGALGDCGLKCVVARDAVRVVVTGLADAVRDKLLHVRAWYDLAGRGELLLVVEVDVGEVVDVVADIADGGGGVACELMLIGEVPLLVDGGLKIVVGGVDLYTGDAIGRELHKLSGGAG